MTQMQVARTGKTTLAMESIATSEHVPLEQLRSDVAAGLTVIVPSRGSAPAVALGDLVRSKVLCNLGTSVTSPSVEPEIGKAKLAVSHGASLICDQSVGPNVESHRARLLQAVPVPLAAVPLYQNAEAARRQHGNPLAFSSDDVVRVFASQVEHGITAPAFHTMTRSLHDRLKKASRVIPIVSRGGGILASWMDRTGLENPYVERFHEVLAICVANDVPLTFVCSCRSGCIADGFDALQQAELEIVAGFVSEAHLHGVGVFLDGLGHMSMDQIPSAVLYCKRTCGGVPLGVMGPATTDRGLGHEHVVNAIGTAIAVQHGANYCNACARTEHLGLPEVVDIPDAIGAAVIATYAGDLARGRFKSIDLDMAIARGQNAWGTQLDLALDTTMARETFRRVGANNKHGEGCSICGDLCPFTVKSFVAPRVP
jgi:phosphomethylpyrimidine synthase